MAKTVNVNKKSAVDQISDRPRLLDPEKDHEALDNISSILNAYTAKRTDASSMNTCASSFIHSLNLKKEKQNGLKLLMEDNAALLYIPSLSKKYAVKKLSGAVVRMRSGKFNLEMSNVFLPSGRKEYPTKISVDIRPVPKSPKGYWWRGSRNSLQILHHLLKFENESYTAILRKVNSIISEPTTCFTGSQSKSFYRYFEGNEDFFRRAQNETKLATILPISYLTKIAKKHNNRLKLVIIQVIKEIMGDCPELITGKIPDSLGEMHLFTSAYREYMEHIAEPYESFTEARIRRIKFIFNGVSLFKKYLTLPSFAKHIVEPWTLSDSPHKTTKKTTKTNQKKRKKGT